jgi:IclR family transcriptional regulator, acetate operon repressor
MRSAESNGRSVLARSFRVLDAFGPGAEELTLSELARRSNVPKGTLHRMVGQLVEVGVLERVHGQYRLGFHLFELSRLVPFVRRLREAALPYMQELYEATHQVVHLGVPKDLEVLYLERIAGRNSFACPTQTGGRMPLYCTSLGKAMLAFSEPALVEQVIRAGLRPLTPYTITVPHVLQRALDRTRDRGVAFDHEESRQGLSCVGAPILRNGVPIAALSIAGPTLILNSQKLSTPLLRAAADLSTDLSREAHEMPAWSP